MIRKQSLVSGSWFSGTGQDTACGIKLSTHDRLKLNDFHMHKTRQCDENWTIFTGTIKHNNVMKTKRFLQAQNKTLADSESKQTNKQQQQTAATTENK